MTTPATLSVEFAAQNPLPTALVAVPNVVFLDLNSANINIMDAASSPWMCMGPQWAVNKVVATTAAQGSYFLSTTLMKMHPGCWILLASL